MTATADRAVPTFELTRWQGRTQDHCVVIPVINEGPRIASLLRRMATLDIPAQALSLIHI